MDVVFVGSSLQEERKRCRRDLLREYFSHVKSLPHQFWWLSEQHFSRFNTTEIQSPTDDESSDHNHVNHGDCLLYDISSCGTSVILNLGSEKKKENGCTSNGRS